MKQEQTCPNCGFQLLEGAKYCSNCGQRNKSLKASLFSLMGEFFGNAFSWDSKIARTLPLLFFKPGQLSLDYFEGKRQRYIPPVRLLIFSSILLFAFGISLQFNQEQEPLETRLAAYDKEQEHRDRMERKKLEIDSLLESTELDTSVRRQVSTAFSNIEANLEPDDSTNIIFAYTDHLNVSNREYYTADIDSLLDSMPVHGMFKRMLYGKVIRVHREGGSFLTYLTSKASWIYFLLIPIVALLLKLLYIRRSRWYTEHIIFSIHLLSCFAFLFVILRVIVPELPDWIDMVLIPLILAYVIAAIWKFYGQSWPKTLLKSVLFCIGSLAAVTISIMIVVGLAIAFF